MTAALLGWLGTAGTLAAYGLLWRGRLTSTSRRYALLNVVGGLLAGTASGLYGAWPSAASNVVWAALGLHSMLARGVGASGGDEVEADCSPAAQRGTPSPVA
ncbi:CBU_0592 family membrane protein [Aeromicrobium fastidiosum]|uniref:CBU_0592 family membrane protein n=1 Tax=Aeromicrobium fastidiosum TaxID=52699 RepID=UPI003CCC55FA